MDDLTSLISDSMKTLLPPDSSFLEMLISTDRDFRLNIVLKFWLERPRKFL